MKQSYLRLALAGLWCGLGTFVFAGGGADPQVLEYVRQIRVQRGRANYAVDVTISAAVPALSKHGILKAIKKQAPQGHLYEGLNYQGDGLIKTNVIARYLTAELEAQRPEEKLATEISPLNYSFKLKGEEKLGSHQALVYEVKPLRKRSGLFRGTVWVDKQTKLPLKEQGKLEKVNSIWIKDIVFTREYEVIQGLSVPHRITSEVNTRIVGKSVINVDFANYRVQDPNAVAQNPANATHVSYDHLMH